MLDEFAPLMKKQIRGNQSRFMNKDFSKAIRKRSALKSKYLRERTVPNRLRLKKQRNLCVSLKRKAIKQDFSRTIKNLKKDSKPFYNLIKPYLTKKGALCTDDITLLENGILVSNESDIVNLFNDYYINKY